MTETKEKDSQTNEDDTLLSEMYRLVPDVCKFLGKQDTNHSEWFVQILVLMDKGDFPVHNICYSLFSDVVQ